MSFFKKLFRKKKDKVCTTEEAIQNLRKTEEMLKEKQSLLKEKIIQEIQIAKKSASKNRQSK